MHREDDLGTVTMVIYVDDCLMIGDKKAVIHAIEEIKKHFEITHSTEIDEFIGCKIERDKNQLFLSQPDLIKKLMEKFGDEMMKLKECETPASQGTHVMRPMSEEEKLTEEEQKIYQPGVGSLFYLLKHSRPDLSKQYKGVIKSHGWNK